MLNTHLSVLIVQEDGTQPVVRGFVHFKQDAGYAETCKLLAEAAICLALDTKSLPMNSGFLTPVAAMGETYLERIRAVGIEFSIVDINAKKTE